MSGIILDICSHQNQNNYRYTRRKDYTMGIESHTDGRIRVVRPEKPELPPRPPDSALPEKPKSKKWLWIVLLVTAAAILYFALK